MRYRYGWDSRQNGLALTVSGVAGVLVQAGLAGRVVRRLGSRRAMLVGLGCGITGLLLYGFGPTDRWVWIAIPVAALWGFYGPAAQTVMTQRVAPTQQGQLQGALASVQGITSLIAPPLYTGVFAAAVERTTLLGAPFYVAALMLGLALFAAIRGTAPSPEPL
jgi:DHA1 family tetracycline resistance protein-like MFS transporter